MATYMVPKNPGRFRVVTSMSGTPLVINDKTGKNKLYISCKTWKQAKDLCDKLNQGDHNGSVRA